MPQATSPWMEDDWKEELEANEALRWTYDAYARRDRLLNAAATLRPPTSTMPDLNTDELEEETLRLMVPTVAAVHASGIYSELLALVAGLVPAEIESIGHIGWKAEDPGSSFKPSVLAFLSEVHRLNQRVSDDINVLALELAARRRRDDSRTE